MGNRALNHLSAIEVSSFIMLEIASFHGFDRLTSTVLALDFFRALNALARQRAQCRSLIPLSYLCSSRATPLGCFPPATAPKTGQYFTFAY